MNFTRPGPGAALRHPHRHPHHHSHDHPHHHRFPRPGLAAGVATGLVLLLAGCGGGGDAAPPASQPPLGNDGRAQALAVSQPGELLSDVRERLRERARLAPTVPGALWNPGSAALQPIATVGGDGAGLGFASPSGTWLQEPGVDEADLLKTDGQLLYLLRPAQPLRVAGGGNPYGPLQVELQRRLGNARLQPLQTVPLAEDSRLDAEQGGLVLSQDGRTLVALTRMAGSAEGTCTPDGACSAPVPSLVAPLPAPRLSVQRVDISAPDDASQTRAGTRVVLDGQLLATRRIGNALVVVSLHRPPLAWDALPPNATPNDREAALSALTVTELLPRVKVDDQPSRPLVAETDCWVQRRNASLAVELTTVTVFDLASPTLAHRSRCFAGGAEAVYVSARHLYLASTRQPYLARSLVQMSYPLDMRTDIHKFSLTGGDVAYRGSGDVPGHLGWDWQRKSLRLSEWNGDLRVLSFTGREGWARVDDALTVTDGPDPSPATLTVLREDPAARALVAVSTLPNAARPAPLGKPGEQVYAVRFVGPRGYVVTFRTVDPLYVLDLSDPADPQVLGELEVPGFSDHLFPLDERLLLGVGREVLDGNRLGGVKLSLFDVGQPARPLELASTVLGQAGSGSALDASRHGLNLQVVGGVARIALPLLEAGAPWGDWHDGLQRFEVNLADGQLRNLGMLGRRASAAGVDLAHQRSLVQGDEVFHLRDDGLSAYGW